MDCPHCTEHHRRMICVECGNTLTADERHYYDGRCNTCEEEWHAELQYWRAGGCNPVFDALYGGNDESKH